METFHVVHELDFMTFEIKRGTLCLKIAGEVDSFEINYIKLHEK